MPRAGEAERAEGMGGDRGHRGLAPLHLSLDHPEGRFRPVGEPGDTHPLTLQATSGHMCPSARHGPRG